MERLWWARPHSICATAPNRSILRLAAWYPASGQPPLRLKGRRADNKSSLDVWGPADPLIFEWQQRRAECFQLPVGLLFLPVWMLLGRAGILLLRKPGTVRNLKVEDLEDTIATAKLWSAYGWAPVKANEKHRGDWWHISLTLDWQSLFWSSNLYLYQRSQLLVAIPDNTACTMMNGDNSGSIGGAEFGRFSKRLCERYVQYLVEKCVRIADWKQSRFITELRKTPLMIYV